MDTPKVTFTLTSCGRLDLLERTLDSFFKFNTYPIEEYIISEDDCNADLGMLKEKYCDKNIVWLQNTCERIGLLRNNDYVHQFVKTPYFFHCEDDWEFFDEGFIEKSIAIMKRIDDILQVWLRKEDDTNGHPIYSKEFERDEVKYKLVKTNHAECWHGFSTNPGLKRMKDKVCYSAIAKIGNQNIGPEARVSEYYYHAGFRAAILPEGYVRHIGDGRTTL